jgi:hypothetical protein
MNAMRERSPVVVHTSSNQNVSFADGSVPASATESATASTAANVTASASSLNDISEETVTALSSSSNQDVVIKSNPVKKPLSNLNRHSFAESLAAVTASTTTIASSLNGISTDPPSNNRHSLAHGESLAVTLPTNGIVCEELKQDDMSLMTGDEGKNMSDYEFEEWAEAQMWNPTLTAISETTEKHYELGKDTNDKVQRCEEMLGDLLQKFNDKQKPKLTKMTKTGLRSLSSSEINSRKTKQPSLNLYAKKPLTIPKGPGCLERAEPKPKPKSFKKKVDTSQQKRWK